jgi:type 1 glutamine amidotransferase
MRLPFEDVDGRNPMPHHALILSGAGRYADPWHPFAATSSRIADILRGEGIEVEISEDVDARLAALADGEAGSAPDLLVLNIGDPALTDPEHPQPEAERLARTGLLAHLAAGRSLLAMHVSSTSLRGVPEWEDILGGVWVRGTTMHPDYSRARIHVYPERHPIVAGLTDFEVEDERYTYLRTAPDLVPLATHEHDGAEFPLLWARSYGDARVVYDALGHDEASYESDAHRAIVAAAARWLLRA